MKMCIIASVNPPNYGNASMHVWAVANALAERGNDIHMILPKMDIRESKIIFYFIKGLGLPKKLFRIWFVFASIFLYLKLKRKHSFDVVYTRSLQNALLVALLKSLINASFVLEVNGIWYEEYDISATGLFKNIKRQLIYIAGRFITRKADGIRAITEGIKNELVVFNINPDRVAVIGNGVDLSLFKPEKNAKKLSFMDGNEKIVCFVGQFYAWQGIEYLIKAAPLILQKVPNTKFLIVGDGEMREAWKNMVRESRLENNFIFTGRVPHEDVPKYINASDVCVALKKPLISGYSTLKLYEYLACGKPVVGSNVTGVGDFLTEHNCGIAVEPGKPKELADAVVALLQNDKLREEMGRNGRRLAIEKYSWGNIAEKVEELCKKQHIPRISRLHD